MLWLLQVRLLAHCPPFGSCTPHCFSTSTGPFGFAALGFCSSFLLFFFLVALSASSSAFRFLPFLVPSSAPSPCEAPLRALPLISSSSSSSSSAPSAFAFARC